MTRSNNWGMFSLASARSNSWLSLKKFRPQNPWYIILTGFKLNKMSYMCEEVYQHCNICNVLYRLCFLSNNGYFNKSNCLHFIPPDQTQSFRGYGNPRGLQWGAKRRMCQGNGVCKMIKCIDEMWTSCHDWNVYRSSQIPRREMEVGKWQRQGNDVCMSCQVTRKVIRICVCSQKIKQEMIRTYQEYQKPSWDGTWTFALGQMDLKDLNVNSFVVRSIVHQRKCMKITFSSIQPRGWIHSGGLSIVTPWWSKCFRHGAT